MNYVPAGKSEIISAEFVEFNSSVTLSQKYAVLGKVAKEMGKVYEKSGDETLAQLAQNYYNMQKEAKYLSKLVEEQLQEYDKEILESSAILMDWDYWVCVAGCIIGWCAAYPSYCEVCIFICTPCFVLPGPVCAGCLTCIGALVAVCGTCCLIFPVC